MSKNRIKLVIFDLDGVLLDAKQIHFKALNDALAVFDEKYIISEQEHIARFDGLPTTDKLEILYEERGLPIELFGEINQLKQEFTCDDIKDFVSPNEITLELLTALKVNGYKCCIASNSVTATVVNAIDSLGIKEFVDGYLSNEDILLRKPYPDIYIKAMTKFSVKPHETLIVEDSPVGLRAAHASGAHVLQVHSVDETNMLNVFSAIAHAETKVIPLDVVWQNKNMNVLIPMAGAGNRFAQEGYELPKPLIDVGGAPMIKRVVDSLNIDANYIFICQKSHYEKYNLQVILNIIKPGCKIITVDGVTDGAARTTLLAKELIDNEDKLLLVNSDQIVDWSSTEFLYNAEYSGADGSILTFRDTASKWSFAKVDESGFVTEVAEKNPISDIATVGIYYWKHGSDYVDAAENMIAKNIRTNNEFYVCPSFNEAIATGKKIRTFEISKECMHGVGTPEDLRKYLGVTNG